MTTDPDSTPADAAAGERPVRPGRPALAVTRVAVVHLLRKQRDSPILGAVVVGFNVFVALTLLGVGGTGTYQLGRGLAAGDVAGVVGRVRTGVLSGLVLVSVMHLLGAASDTRTKHRRVPFLTATTTGTVVVALLVRRCVAAFVLFGPGLLVGVLGFAVGAGAPVAAVSMGVATVWLLVATTVLTFPLGLVANWVLVGYDLSSGGRTALGGVVLGGFYLALFGREAVAAALGTTPVAWAGDLFLLTVPGAGADPVRAGAFAAASVAVVGVAVGASRRLAAVTWYSDPTFGTDDDASDRTTADGFGRGLRRVCSQQTAALVAATWRRTRRTPKTLFYVYPSLLVGILMVEQLVLNGPFSAALVPVVVAFAGATAVGSGFTLNPLGTEGDALPAVLTAGVGSDRFVRAKALAAAIPGVPLVVGTAVGVGVGLAGLPVAVLVAAVAYALALVAAATLFSQALGVHYPPDHEELLGGSVKVPNKSASVAYSVGMVVVAVPGFAGLGQYARTGAVEPVVLLGGTAVSVLAAAALARASYRHAVSRLDAYSVE